MTTRYACFSNFGLGNPVLTGSEYKYLKDPQFDSSRIPPSFDSRNFDRQSTKPELDAVSPKEAKWEST